jgi:hypothetical protein
MKLLRGVSLFFVYPLLMLSLGFVGGILFVNSFHKPSATSRSETQAPNSNAFFSPLLDASDESLTVLAQKSDEPTTVQAQNETLPESEPDYWGASAGEDRINADTQYVLEETDIRNHSVVETSVDVPPKYIGMMRQQFVEAMQEYEDSPPLSELERGFVGLEVVSFSKQRVVIQMNYEYVQPTTSFYLCVENHNVVVYLEDLQTVYMDTDIAVAKLPEGLMQEIIDVKFIENEEALFDFLEMYSS